MLDNLQSDLYGNHGNGVTDGLFFSSHFAQVIDGYFVHYIAPAYLEPMPKDVMFILDDSGSMSGQKITQTKEAMYTILDQLQPADRLANTIILPSKSIQIQYFKKYPVSLGVQVNEGHSRWMTRDNPADTNC